MSDVLDVMGPVDYIVVEFPDANVPKDVLPRLVDLVDQHTVRILDLAFLRKETDGSVIGLDVTELGDDEVEARVFEGAPSGLVGADDMDDIGAVIEPGRAALVVLYENVWAIPFASALRGAGAELVASGRVPVAALLDTLDEVDAARPVDA
jgi:uncharacterized membrane protein